MRHALRNGRKEAGHQAACLPRVTRTSSELPRSEGKQPQQAGLCLAEQPGLLASSVRHLGTCPVWLALRTGFSPSSLAAEARTV